MARWQTMRGATEHYVVINGTTVTVGEHSGSGRTDYASSCTLAEFLERRFDALIRRVHGQEALAEMWSDVHGRLAEKPDG